MNDILVFGKSVSVERTHGDEIIKKTIAFLTINIINIWST